MGDNHGVVSQPGALHGRLPITPEALVQRILELEPGRRVLVAVAGPPASGKSTLAHKLSVGIRDLGRSAAVVPMDGFHFDDAILKDHGDLDRKGAPWTFDIGGFTALVERLSTNSDDVIYVPVFDRGLELSRASSRAIPSTVEVLVIEGSYLLLDDPEWGEAAKYYGLTVMLEADLTTLQRRLLDRWLGFGLSFDAAQTKAAENDVPNAKLVVSRSRRADVYFSNTCPGNREEQ